LQLDVVVNSVQVVTVQKGMGGWGDLDTDTDTVPRLANGETLSVEVRTSFRAEPPVLAFVKPTSTRS
jgi:hypothetical protein